MSVKPVPNGYHTVTPYLAVKGADKAIEFYKKAFGAEVVDRMTTPDGGVCHASIQIGDSRIMLADEFPQMGFTSPISHGCKVMLHLYVQDVDKWVERAVKAGGKLTREVKNQFYGDRSGAVEDAFGYTWHVSTHVEDVSDDELKKRQAEVFKSMGHG